MRKFQIGSPVMRKVQIANEKIPNWKYIIRNFQIGIRKT